MATLGIDIGGSGIKGAMIDVEKGEMVSPRHRIPTPGGAKPSDVAKVVHNIAAHFECGEPIGCGFPAVVRNGLVLTAANVDSSWINTNANDLFSAITGCSTFVLNDADAAGMAEMRFGAGKEFQKGVVLVVTLGTGIGSAIFTDGKLLPNTEFGHIQIRGKDAEWRASDAARQRKHLSWKNWAKRLHEYLSYMEKLLWPDLIILGGGISKNSNEFLPFLDLQAKVIPARMLNQAGMVGAAIFASEQKN
jgi:polyphosphate glucokinase